MRWGVLFRREISLTYARIQDIHLVSNILERWLGLARIQIQTASGSAVAEITIEGLPDFEAVRDFLYERMRSSRGQRSRASVQQTRPATAAPPEELPEGHAQELPAATVASPQVMLEVVQALRDTTAELRALRQQLEDRDGRQKGGGS